jgi:hypothetical protein
MIGIYIIKDLKVLFIKILKLLLIQKASGRPRKIKDHVRNNIFSNLCILCFSLKRFHLFNQLFKVQQVLNY